jgi:hypothetical protein
MGRGNRVVRSRPTSVTWRLIDGVIAGAAGTCTINLLTYLDMAARGRPSSDVPAKTAARLGEVLGIWRTGEGEHVEADDRTKDREQGIGALLGFVDGIMLGAVYALVAPPWPRPVAAVTLGLVAMGASDAVSAMLGVTHPTQWSARDWLADALPHLGYGLVAAYTFDRVTTR